MIDNFQELRWRHFFSGVLHCDRFMIFLMTSPKFLATYCKISLEMNELTNWDFFLSVTLREWFITSKPWNEDLRGKFCTFLRYFVPVYKVSDMCVKFRTFVYNFAPMYEILPILRSLLWQLCMYLYASMVF
jgi:hypothetical protein